jgi:hypothetical protein
MRGAGMVRKHGVSEQSICRWKSTYSGMDVAGRMISRIPMSVSLRNVAENCPSERSVLLHLTDKYGEIGSRWKCP